VRILYISQYFPPEIGATQTRAYEMARGLVAAGHQVTMLTEVPNHPVGIVFHGYRNKLWVRQDWEGIDVLHLWVRASPKKNTANRLLFYSSFSASATILGLLIARGKYDLVYCTSPPLFVGLAGLAISIFKRLPFVFEVRDLWPEVAIQLGELREGWAAQLAEWLEETCYRRACHLVLVTQGMKDRLVERGFPGDKMSVIPNGANMELYQPGKTDPALRSSLGLQPGEFVVTYTGLHGLAHDLEDVLEAADILRSQADIRFLFIGDGPTKSKLQALAAQKSLSNVIFHQAVPEQDLPKYINLADVGIDAIHQMSTSRGTLPVKMFSYMACQIPVLLAIEGEASELLHEAQAGIAVSPGSPGAIAEAILELRADPVLRAEMGRAGRAYVEDHYNRQAQAQQLVNLLMGLIDQNKI
jgi:glycosyltransferase involved in cell wall biosynthesis